MSANTFANRTTDAESAVVFYSGNPNLGHGTAQLKNGKTKKEKT